MGAWYKLAGQRFGRLEVLRVGISKACRNGTRKYWVCKCDCGKERQVVGHALTSGKTRSCGCIRREMAKAALGPKHHNWKGGKRDHDGYVAMYMPKHPRAWGTGYVLEHIVVMTEKLGRDLLPRETVHHKNGVKNDNRPENLEPWSSSHPCGQRIEDKVSWCVEFLSLYAPETLK